LRGISFISPFLPFVLFLFFIKKNNRIELWAIFTYILVSFAADLALSLTKSKLAYFTVLHIFTALEYLFFSVFFFIAITHLFFKKLILLFSVLFYLFIGFYYYYGPGNAFDSIPASVESTLVIIYCIYFLYEQISQPQISFIYMSDKFWIATGCLIYLAGTLFLFIYASNLTEAQTKFYWTINFLFNVLKNLSFGVAFIMKKEPAPYPSAEGPYNDILQNPYKNQQN
jgi:hypothetical protein